MRPGRPTWIALCFALAALAACWSPLAAPFGLITGLGAAVLAFRARRDGGRPATAALAVALLASGVAAWVLVLAAGLARQPVHTTAIPPAGEQATGQRLDEAAEQSRPARQRALEQAAPGTGAPPRN